MKKWAKKGLVYVPTGEKEWARSHAYLPTAHLFEDKIRVYYAALDKQKMGRISFVDLDASDPSHILYEHDKPVLDLGHLGSFDDCGVTPSCALLIGTDIYLYYIGWQRTYQTPYMLFSGLAISKDGGKTFERVQRVPVIDRSPEEPYSRGAPFVYRSNKEFQAYYWSCVNWSEDNGLLHYNNDIRKMASQDGIHWPQVGEICIRADHPQEYSVGRPWILENEGLFTMWFSSRALNRSYRIGVAYSKDGIHWIRDDENGGIAPSENGWDSEMVCFPCIVEAYGRTFMFYNGNGHGSTGFGYAELL